MAILISHVLLLPNSLACLSHAPTTFPWNRQSFCAFKSLYRVAARGRYPKEVNQMEEAIVDADKFRVEFLRVLRSRRSGEGAKIEFECCFFILDLF